ncbi:hypothetical protein ACFE04_010079 [Oxalis oulophora]
MAKEMKVEIVTREIIKPSSPTPPNLKTYNLSFFDQKAPNVYVSILLFYPFNKNNDLYHEETDERSKRLKSSLSKTLTRFYPFAGRLNENVSIECYDEGAIFIEARVHGFMTLVLEEPDYSIRKKFRLCGNHPGDMETKNHLLQVQANFFECGGLAISVSTSHKLADASTMSTFIKAWSAITLNPDNVDPTCFADFSLSSKLPIVNPSSSFVLNNSGSSIEPNFALKRYVFDESKMNRLKKKVISEGVKNPTRVECVSSLLWKCLMATSRSRYGVERPSNFIQTVNLRSRTIPPLPLNSIGNMAITFSETTKETSNLNNLITNLRRGLRETSKRVENGFKEEEFVSYYHNQVKEVGYQFISQGDETYFCTSWCRFPFYEADFGWGKPTWVCPCVQPLENFFVFMDTRDGHGIETWCPLSEEKIALLERDEEFLIFARS